MCLLVRRLEILHTDILAKNIVLEWPFLDKLDRHHRSSMEMCCVFLVLFFCFGAPGSRICPFGRTISVYEIPERLCGSENVTRAWSGEEWMEEIPFLCELFLLTKWSQIVATCWEELLCCIRVPMFVYLSSRQWKAGLCKVPASFLCSPPLQPPPNLHNPL